MNNLKPKTNFFKRAFIKSNNQISKNKLGSSLKSFFKKQKKNVDLHELEKRKTEIFTKYLSNQPHGLL